MTALGPMVFGLATCLQGRFRTNAPQLHGNRATFELVLTPSPLVDAPLVLAPPAAK